MEQHDAHVRRARQSRTLFYSETEPGCGIELRASYGVPEAKLAWIVLRFCEARRMELDGSWRADLERLEAILETRAARKAA